MILAEHDWRPRPSRRARRGHSTVCSPPARGVLNLGDRTEPPMHEHEEEEEEEDEESRVRGSVAHCAQINAPSARVWQSPSAQV